MRKLTKKILKKVPVIIFAGSLVFSDFGVIFAQTATTFNTDPQDLATVRVSNYTLYPNSTSNWGTSVSASAGQVISVAIYYHNTGGATATNTRIRLNSPSGTSNTFSISGGVSADNAPPANSSATVNISSNQTLTYIPGSTQWYPNQSQSPVGLPNGQNGSEVFGEGLNIGNIAPGWSTQGSVVLRFQISNTQPPVQQPSVTTNAATGIGESSATLNGYVNPNGTSDTIRWFEWGLSSSNLTNSTARLSQGSSASSFSEFINGLSPSTYYYFRAVAQNSAGTVYGSVRSFRTLSVPQPSLPSVTTFSPTNIGDTYATFNGFVTQNAGNTYRWFEYYTSGTGIMSTRRVYQGGSASNFSEYVNGLKPNTVYYVRAVAQNSYGTDYGVYHSFTTTGVGNFGSNLAPLVITNPAIGVSNSAAVLQGLAFTNGINTYGWFEWGTNFNLTSQTEKTLLGVNYSAPFSATLGGLPANTIYYFRAVAQNAYGTARGVILSFRTGSEAVSPPVSNGVFSGFSVKKEVENVTFPNGTKTSVAATADDTLRYHIRVTNTGTTPLSGISVRDTLSPFTDFSSASDGGSYSADDHRVSWTIDNLGPGLSRTLTVDVTAQKLTSNVVAENTARAEAADLGARFSNTTLAIINVQQVVLSIENGREDFPPGGVMKYKVSYANKGKSEVKNLDLTVVLPAGVSFEGSPDGFSEKDNVLKLNLPNLAGEGKGEVSFDAKVSSDIKEETTITTSALLTYTDVVENVDRGVNAYVLNVVRPSLGPLGASLIGGVPMGFLWLLLIITVTVIGYGVYLMEKNRREPQLTREVVS
ncbi:MAG TPA: hypothetical protein VNK70_00675 [Candidatus Paceibacterota bacterium]|nr:hypothetical protein [Candidatus Paceibacterota bacterium]